MVCGKFWSFWKYVSTQILICNKPWSAHINFNQVEQNIWLLVEWKILIYQAQAWQETPGDDGSHNEKRAPKEDPTPHADAGGESEEIMVDPSTWCPVGFLSGSRIILRYPAIKK